MMYMAAPTAVLSLSPIGLPAAVFSSNTMSSLLCIGAISGLSSQKTAQFGCGLGIAGVAGATAGAISVVPVVALPSSLACIAAGGAAGYGIGSQVEPMKLPQTVAAFHSLVGAAATLTSIASFMAHPDSGAGHKLAAVLGDSIGAITLTGSII